MNRIRLRRILLPISLPIFVIVKMTGFASAGPLVPGGFNGCIEDFRTLASQTVVSPENRSRFQREIKSASRTLRSLQVSADSIQHVVSAEEGASFASAVAVVDTPSGKKFLKVWESSSPASMAHTIAIQNALARQGMAPMVTGYLPPKELKQVFKNFPELKMALNGRPYRFGVLMDHIEIQTEIGLRTRVPSSWTAEMLEKRVREFEQAMEALRIVPAMDLQAAIDRSGHLVLYDFDGYGHVTEDHRVYSTVRAGTVSFREFMDVLYKENIELQARTETDRFQIDRNGKFRVELKRLRRDLGILN